MATGIRLDTKSNITGTELDTRLGENGGLGSRIFHAGATQIKSKTSIVQALEQARQPPEVIEPRGYHSSISSSEEEEYVHLVRHRSDIRSTKIRTEVNGVRSKKSTMIITESTLALEKSKIEKYQVRVLSSNVLTHNQLQYTIHKCIDSNNITYYVVGQSIENIIQQATSSESNIPAEVSTRAYNCIHNSVDGLVIKYQGQFSLLLLSPSLTTPY